MPAHDDPVAAALERFDRLSQAMLVVRAAHGPPWADLNITFPQLRVIGLLSCSAPGLSGRELAGLLGVGPSAVTPLVDRLVEHGYVCREEDRQDRRVTRMRLTESGEALLQRMTAGRREQMADLLRRLDAAELAVVTRAFEILSQATERERADASAAAPLAAGAS